MVDSAKGQHIQLHDFIIGSALPLPKLLRHPSRLVLKFSIDGVGEKVLTTRRDIEDGTWEADGNVKICEHQLLTATILVYVEDSTKELGTVTVSYSQLLAHVETRSTEYYEFIVDASTSSVLLLITCSIKTLGPLPQKQRIFTEPSFSPGKSKSDEGRSGSNRTLTPNASSTLSIADLERHYRQATRLPAERKSQALNDIGWAYHSMYIRTNEMKHLEQAISILTKASQNAMFHAGLPECLDDLAICLLERFIRTRSFDDIGHAISKSRDAVHLAETSDPNRHWYILHHGTALLMRYEGLGKLDDLQNSILFMNVAAGLVPDGHPDKPVCLSSLGGAFKTRFDRLGRVEDLEIAIVYERNAIDLTLDGHPDKSKYLNNLGGTFKRRFDRFDRIKDLETAILYEQKAIDLTPDSHLHKPRYLMNLGSALETRFHRLGRVEDLGTAIVYEQKAVDLTPDGHPDKPKYLNKLGGTFKRRFDRLGRVEDLELAIVHGQKGVHLTPDSHSHKPRNLDNLGTAFQTRFNRLGRVEDLEVAIVHKQRAVDLMPDGHPDKPEYLNNLGSAFKTRFDRLGRVEDLEIVIAHVQEAINVTPDGHPDKPRYLNNLEDAFKTRFDRLGCIEDLELAIAHMQEAVDLTPNAHRDKARNLIMLGKSFVYRFRLLKRIKDVRMALIQFSTAASLPTAGPRDRLNATRDWASTTELLETFGVPNSSPLESYHVAIDLLPRVAWLSVPVSTQHTLPEDTRGIVRDAVTAAIKVEEYNTAVEWGEAGRSITWQNLLNLRTPVDELRRLHCNLAEGLEAISRQLDMSVRGSDGGVNSATDGMEEDPRNPVKLALDWDIIVADIRSKPGFESFFKPKSFNQLGRIARDGPVAILNDNKDRCDALVLIPKDNGDVYISNISLIDFSYGKGEALLKELNDLLSSKHLRNRDSRKAIRKPIDGGNELALERILRCLWLDVVKPIIEALTYQPRSTDLPHIWWCATGPLAFLPIHAAGLYDTDDPGSKLSDYVVSSYTPTLSALLEDSTPSQEVFRLLAIAQANAPGMPSIPGTEAEVNKIKTLASNFNITTMTNDATVEDVWRGMEKSSWVHLACHGQQNIKEPMKSGLLLHDGTLTLQRLIEKPLPLADFAFLSACQTATGDENEAEESLHLAAGMLFAGYKGVIATMWPIIDDVGPQVAEDVYQEMLKDGKPNRKVAAHALHKAVKRLREDPKVEMLHWVSFIHMGV